MWWTLLDDDGQPVVDVLVEVQLAVLDERQDGAAVSGSVTEAAAKRVDGWAPAGCAARAAGTSSGA